MKVVQQSFLALLFLVINVILIELYFTGLAFTIAYLGREKGILLLIFLWLFGFAIIGGVAMGLSQLFGFLSNKVSNKVARKIIKWVTTIGVAYESIHIIIGMWQIADTSRSSELILTILVTLIGLYFTFFTAIIFSISPEEKQLS